MQELPGLEGSSDVSDGLEIGTGVVLEDGCQPLLLVLELVSREHMLIGFIGQGIKEGVLPEVEVGVFKVLRLLDQPKHATFQDGALHLELSFEHPPVPFLSDQSLELDSFFQLALILFLNPAETLLRS